METWHIHIKGQVQGVGFRPFVFRLAQKQNLKGWVCNSMDGIHIEINTNEVEARSFLQEIKTFAPAISSITDSQLQKVEAKNYDHFQIVESTQEEAANLLLSPDFGICLACRDELHFPKHRRQGYHFITCTNCGPRYSIIRKLPYDRPFTTMDSFEMCDTCREEYENPNDRRFFSQTNSCPQCAICQSLYENERKLLTKNKDAEIIAQIVAFWLQGKIIAIKGIGGYLLTCDAENEAAIKQMRWRKHRPTKPFALMFPNLEMLKKEASISEKETKEMQSPAAPIVLLSIKKKAKSRLKKNLIAPNLKQIGVMLPYTPLFELLMTAFGKPIIATSANISHAPIVFEDQKALDELTKMADYVLINDREIVVPQDDSVVKYTPFHQQKIIIRRSRGLAPNYIQAGLNLPTETIFAAGAMLKSSFSYLHQGNVFISQYLGDLGNFDALESYQLTARHFFRLFHDLPKRILCDAHPEYASSIFAEQLADTLKCPIFKVQHHLAHFAAILGEKDLLHTSEPILGVIWDGTGLGSDNQIWGGEFFLYEKYHFERIAHLPYFDFMLGDKMPKEPRISALSLCKNLPEASAILSRKFTEEEWKIYRNLLTKNKGLQTSSMGRLFDGVASLLGICDRQTFEGEAAMLLEASALEYFTRQSLNFSDTYPFLDSKQKISKNKLLLGIVNDLIAKKPIAYIAAKFHVTLTQIIDWVAEKNDVQHIAFSGGVFQNAVLLDLVLQHLSHKYKLYWHNRLSPNDENVSFGQLIYYQIKQLSAKKRIF